MPAHVRLRKRSEYRDIYASGLRIRGTLLVIFVVATERGFPRLGITVTRRVGSAVVRNRIRRLIREVFRCHRQSLESWDIVVNATSAAVGKGYAEVERDLLGLLRKARRRAGGAEEKKAR